MNILDKVNQASLVERPDFRAGDTVKVNVNVVEGNRAVSRFSRASCSTARAVRASTHRSPCKASFGVGVERTFPLHSPNVDSIEIVSRGRVRRAKLYYLRDRHGKAAKIREKRED